MKRRLFMTGAAGATATALTGCGRARDWMLEQLWGPDPRMTRSREGLTPPPVRSPAVPVSERLAEVEARRLEPLRAILAQNSHRLGNPVYLRIFKQEKLLEAFIYDPDVGQYQQAASFPVCTYSGGLGPKLKEGDHQSPEGFYTVGRGALNPRSRFHLSFNLGFPNPVEKAQGRTGSYLMVHGGCASVGCYAMTDPYIEDIYLMVQEALKTSSEPVPVHAFPFRMTAENLAAHSGSEWSGFWREMAQADQLFLRTGLPPQVSADGAQYAFAPGVKPDAGSAFAGRLPKDSDDAPDI